MSESLQSLFQDTHKPQDQILREGCKVKQHDLLNHHNLLKGMIGLDATLLLSLFQHIQAFRRE